VGANNSSKTSTGHALQLFTSGAKNKFSIHYFHFDSWDCSVVDGIPLEPVPPVISLDAWFEICENNLHWVVELLPNLQWGGGLVEFELNFREVLSYLFNNNTVNIDEKFTPYLTGTIDGDDSQSVTVQVFLNCPVSEMQEYKNLLKRFRLLSLNKVLKVHNLRGFCWLLMMILADVLLFHMENYLDIPI